jgi:RimJ/RimL family protein N-acetyltransferase
MTSYHLTLLQEEHAFDILGWRYPEPYNFYNPPDDRPAEEYVREFVRPEYQFHAVLDGQDQFSGFCSFGLDGQVPGGNYQKEALDIGLGMRPELTGRGRGYQFFRSILQHAHKTFEVKQYRLTVANFNERALRLYQHFGFVCEDEFTDSVVRVSYTILVRQANSSGAY